MTYSRNIAKTHLAASSGPLDLSLCGLVLFRGRYIFVKTDPTCSVCQRSVAKLPGGLPAVPEKGNETEHLSKSKAQRSGGVVNA